MQTRFRNTISVLAILAAAGAAPALAQDLDIGEVVVTANKTPTEKSKVGSTVYVVTKKDIEQQSLPSVVDYLNQIPGVTYSAPGNMGQEGSLSIRGLPRRYIKTLYNGIDISDPTAPQVQTSYQYLLGGIIGNIEVLEGSQSTLYGSDAIAGVVSVSTLGADINNGVHQYVYGEGGSFGTAQAGYGLTAANSTAKIGLDIAGLHTDGISLAANGTEADGYDNITADLNGEYIFSDNFSVFASGIYIKGRAEFDNEFPISDSLTAVNRNEQIAGRLGFNLKFMDGKVNNTFSIQGMNVDREIDGTSFDGRYIGHRRKADYQGSFAATDWLLLQYGADYEEQSIAVPGTKANFSIGGLWAQATINPLDNFVFTAGLRHDEHSAFGGHTTYRVTGSYLLEETGTRFHASAGSGFRAPSLNELYGPSGANPNLKPETSISFDAGVEQHFLNNSMVADVTFFKIDVDNLIGYVCPDPAIDPSCFSGGYSQTSGTTRSYGMSSSLRWHANSWLDLNSAYTYTHSRNPDGNPNIRVPRHQIGLGFAAQPWEKWMISSQATVVLDTVDSGGVKLDDYVLLNAKISYKPTDATEIYLRGENLLNEKYEVVKGYGTPGLGVFAGFKATF